MDQKVIAAVAVVVVVLVVGGVGFYYNNQQQSSEIAFLPQEDVQLFKREAREVAKSAEQELDKAAAETDKAQQQAQAQADSLQAKIKDLIAKAKAYLDDGNYEQAIKIAQQVLTNFDPGSSEARGIVQQAKDGLKKLAQKKLSEDPAGAVQGAMGGLLGQ